MLAAGGEALEMLVKARTTRCVEDTEGARMW